MKNFCVVVTLILISALPAYAGKWSTGTTAPATCAVGDSWTDTNGTADNRFYTCTSTNTWTLNSNQTAIDAKANKVGSVMSWSEWGDGASFATSSPPVAYNGSLYKCIAPYTKVAGETPNTQTEYFAEVTGSGGGIAHATSDGAYYASRNGAWSNLAGVFLTPTGSAAGLTGFPSTLATDSEVTSAVATKANTSAFASAVAFEAAFGWAPGSGSISLSTEQNWTAVQNFNAGLTATGLTQNLTSWGDWTFGGTQIVNASGTGDNQLLPASAIISRLAAKADGIHTHPGVYEPVDPTILRTGDIDSKAELEVIVGESLGGTGTFSFDSFPAYENSPYVSKIAFDGTTGTLAIYDSSSSKWMLSAAGAFTDTLDPAPVSPTLTGITIGVNGTDLTLTSAASLTNGTIAGNVDCATAGQDIAFTYASGSPGTSLVYTLNSTVTAGDVCNLDYISGITATSGGVALSAISDGGITNNSTQSSGIFDNFDTNTIANYTAINGSLTVSSGVMAGVAWADRWMHHSTATGADNHWAQADISAAAASAGDGGAIGVRSNGTTGYFVTILSGTPGQINLKSFNGATASGVGSSKTPNISAGVHTVKLAVSGSTFEVWLDGVSQGTWTDSTYTTGQYIVVGSRNGSTGTPHTVDNLSGGL